MTRQQVWANQAFERIRKAAESSHGKAYRSVVMGAPILIRQCGLVQAIAFWKTRSEKAAQEFLADLARTLGVKGGEGGLLEAACNASLPSYLALSRDAVEVAMWFRRFAQSEIEEE